MNLNWIAIERAEDACQLLEDLGLQEVGAAHNEWAEGHAYACTVMPGGWLVLTGTSLKLELDELLPTLSARRQVLAGEVYETVMVSTLQAWEAGVRLWSVVHGAEAGAETFEIAGSPPEAFTEIRARQTALQAEGEGGDHLFDAPLDLGAQICGYRPGEWYAGPWTLLEPARRGSGPVLSALPTAIRAELLPALAERGWNLAPIRLASSGRTYDASRIRNGRLEARRFLWSDDRRDVDVVPSYAVVDGERPDGRVLVSGNFYRDGPSLFQQLVARVRRLGQPAVPYEEKVRQALAQARADLVDHDRFITEDAVRLLAG
jgi:hypothetical protein